MKKSYSTPQLTQLVRLAARESPRRVNRPRAEPAAAQAASGSQSFANSSQLAPSRASLSGSSRVDLSDQTFASGYQAPTAGVVASTMSRGSLMRKVSSSPHLNEIEMPAAGTGRTFFAPSASRNEVISCRFRSCGCSVRLSRSRMDNHLRTNAAAHSLLVLDKIDTLSRDNERLKSQVSSLEGSMEAMTKLFEALQDSLGRESGSDVTKVVVDALREKLSAVASQVKRAASKPKSGEKRASPWDTATGVVSASTPTGMPAGWSGLRATKRQRKSPALTPAEGSTTPAPFSANSQFVYPTVPSGPPNATRPALEAAVFPALDPMVHTVPSERSASSTVNPISPATPLDDVAIYAQTQKAAERAQQMVLERRANGGRGGRKRKTSRSRKGKTIFDAPKKPKTAYNYYQIGVRESILREVFDERDSKEVRSQKVARVIGERWKLMPDDQRAVFNRMAASDKQRYKRELEEFSRIRAQLSHAVGGGGDMNGLHYQQMGPGMSGVVRLQQMPDAGQYGALQQMGHGGNF